MNRPRWTMGREFRVGKEDLRARYEKGADDVYELLHETGIKLRHIGERLQTMDLTPAQREVLLQKATEIFKTMKNSKAWQEMGAGGLMFGGALVAMSGGTNGFGWGVALMGLIISGAGDVLEKRATALKHKLIAA